MYTFEPYNKEKLNVTNWKRTDNQRLIEDFVASDLDCVKVIGWHHNNATNCARALNASAKRYHWYHVKAMTRKGEVFLIKLND